MDKKFNVKIGYAPTRRDIFSKEDAFKYKELIKQKLVQWNLDFVDIDWLNEEGLLYDADSVDKIVKKFNDEGVDAVFSPHCNFGTEDAVAKLAKRMNKPFLLWGPRDEMPLSDGSRLRDSQCGLFATSKVLSRMGVPFSYIENCRIDEPVFVEGFKRFIAAACVVKAFKNMRIGQIDTRPQGFWSVMTNESELLERFGIEIVPITLIEISDKMNKLINDKPDFVKSEVLRMRERLSCDSMNDMTLSKFAALKNVINDWAEKETLSGIAIQCWSAMQDILGIMPCYINSELTEEYLPVACEVDINGAISAVIAQAAMMWTTPIFFAGVTIRHPQNDNAELLWHCGPFPYSLKKEGAEAKISEHYILETKCPGICEWEIKSGDVTICRFDGLNGKYNLFAAAGKGVEGPKTRGTYIWVEFRNWPELEKKIIYGPYIHHVAGIHGNIIPVLEETAKYLPELVMDFVK